MLGFVYTFLGNQPINGWHSVLTVDSAHSTGIKGSILTCEILFTSALTLIQGLCFIGMLLKNSSSMIHLINNVLYLHAQSTCQGSYSKCVGFIPSRLITSLFLSVTFNLRFIWRDSPCNQCSVLCSMTNKLYVLFYEMLIALPNLNANNFVIMLHFASNLN